MSHYTRRTFNKDLLVTSWGPENTKKIIMKQKYVKFSLNVPVELMDILKTLSFPSQNKAFEDVVKFSLSREKGVNETEYTGKFKVFVARINPKEYIKLLDRKAKNQAMRHVITSVVTKEAIQEYIRFNKVTKQ